MRNLRAVIGSTVAAGVVVAGVLVAVPTAGQAATDAATADAGGRKVTWAACSDPSLEGLECGTLSVPLDYDRPEGKKITLALSRLKHTVPDSQYQGIMLVNPGGPGGSGLSLAVLGQFVPNGVGGAYDWIGFDPRGVGASTPALSCIPTYGAGPRPDYVPTTKAIESKWLALSKSYAAACGKNGADLLPHLTTVDSVRDMDSIRAALGAKQLNYYGYSYGTYLGQVYSTLFPSRVRRMVLDSNVDPTSVWYQANLDQDVAFQRNIEIYWSWVAKYDSVYHLGTTEKAVEKAWYADQTKIGKKPVPAGKDAQGRDQGAIGASEWNDVFLGAGYVAFLWPELTQMWLDYRAGDYASLISEYVSSDSPTDDNGYAMYNGVQCVDAAWPRDWNTWREDNWRVYRKAPFETWGNAWFNAPCAFWPAKAGKPVNVDGSKVGPVLLIDETLDAATPFAGSLEVRRRFPKSSLIALPGGTNHAFSLSGNACLDDQIATYLASGAVPPRKSGAGPDTTCDPLPVPDPTAPATSAAAPNGAARTAATTSSSSLSVRQQLQRKLIHGNGR